MKEGNTSAQEQAPQKLSPEDQSSIFVLPYGDIDVIAVTG